MVPLEKDPSKKNRGYRDFSKNPGKQVVGRQQRRQGSGNKR